MKHAHNIARTNPFRGRIADVLRKYADRIDPAGAPKAMHVRFTFEDRVGIVFRDDGRGCRLWYYGDADYERAHTEAGPVAGANSTAWLPRRNVPAAAERAHRSLPGVGSGGVSFDFSAPQPTEQDIRRARLEYTERNGGLMSPSARAELAQLRAETGEHQ